MRSSFFYSLDYKTVGQSSYVASNIPSKLEYLGTPISHHQADRRLKLRVDINIIYPLPWSSVAGYYNTIIIIIILIFLAP